MRLDAGANAGGSEFDWSTAREHCRLAYLRGRFLARGSLSLAGGRTHLEFVVPVEEAPTLAQRLAEVGLPARARVRRGRGVVTWKSADTVGTFLRRAGAGASLLELEARQVARALRGELNRVINAESQLIRLEDLNSAAPLPHNLPQAEPAAKLTGGRDGIEVLTAEDFVGFDHGPGDRTGLMALGAVDQVAMLSVPDIMIAYQRTPGPQADRDVQRMIRSCDRSSSPPTGRCTHCPARPQSSPGSSRPGPPTRPSCG